jgi:predicted O-methyltransferase YrrM
MTSARLLYRSDTGWRRRHVFGALGLRRPCAECTEAEAQLLREHVAGARCVVELGVAEGGSAVQLRSAMAADGSLYLVDPYTTGPTAISFARIVARRVLASSSNGRVVWLRATSADAARTWVQPIDLLHIDADHALERARGDWEDWHVHVPIGGAVAFHDSVAFPGGWLTPEWGSVRVVESILADRDDWRLAARVDSTSVLRRIA